MRGVTRLPRVECGSDGSFLGWHERRPAFVHVVERRACVRRVLGLLLLPQLLDQAVWLAKRLAVLSGTIPVGAMPVVTAADITSSNTVQDLHDSNAAIAFSFLPGLPSLLRAF